GRPGRGRGEGRGGPALPRRDALRPVVQGPRRHAQAALAVPAGGRVAAPGGTGPAAAGRGLPLRPDGRGVPGDPEVGGALWTFARVDGVERSEEHTSELQSL